LTENSTFRKALPVDLGSATRRRILATMAAQRFINPGLFEFSAMAIPQFAQVEMTAAPVSLNLTPMISSAWRQCGQ
jgi:hypothetical protein